MQDGVLCGAIESAWRQRIPAAPNQQLVAARAGNGYSLLHADENRQPSGNAVFGSDRMVLSLIPPDFLLLLLAGGLLLATMIWVVWRRSGGVARTPIDLCKPITDADWDKIRKYNGDPAYREAVGIVRNAYRFV